MFEIVAASPLESPLVVGLVVGLPATFGIVWSIRRGAKVDKVAAEAAAATAANAQTQTMVGGLNSVIANLQADNKVLRDHVSDLSGRLTSLGEANRDLQRRVDDLIKKYNGENGDRLTPAPH